MAIGLCINHNNENMKTNPFLYILSLASLLFISACEKDPEVPNEEELITTLKYTLTPVGGGTPVIFSFKDLDGDGGNAPVIQEGTLEALALYDGAIELLNESQSPAVDITEEVMEESDEHQFFYTFSNVNATSVYTDMDSNSNPVGIGTLLSTGTASEGTITITLRHLPDKFAAGVSNGDITNAGGETDIEVTFQLKTE